MKKLKAGLTAVKKSLFCERGQDLVEYALVVALIAFASTAGMKSLAGKINTTFVTLGTDLTSDVA